MSSIACWQSYPEKSGPMIIGRLAHGSDIIKGLEAFCTEHHITGAWINLLGAVSVAELAYYDQVSHTYHTRQLQGEYEIVSGVGNISLKDGKPFAHVHLVLSGTDYQCLGGHLMPGSTQVFACEFSLQVFSSVSTTASACSTPALERHPDPQTGLALWRCLL